MKDMTPRARFERRRAAIVARMNELDEHLLANLDLDTGYMFGDEFRSDDLARAMLNLHRHLAFCAEVMLELTTEDVASIIDVIESQRGGTLQ